MAMTSAAKANNVDRLIREILSTLDKHRRYPEYDASRYDKDSPNIPTADDIIDIEERALSFCLRNVENFTH